MTHTSIYCQIKKHLPFTIHSRQDNLSQKTNLSVLGELIWTKSLVQVFYSGMTRPIPDHPRKPGMFAMQTNLADPLQEMHILT